jgi:two-component system, LuxR family, response regulator FixJ
VSPLDAEPMVQTTTQSERWVGIIDDDASIRRSLARVLRLEGARVETFASAAEFMERRVRGAPDCLILDVHLGGLSGFELHDYLMAIGAAPPIIFITAHDDIPSSRSASAGGVCGYLRKPFDVAALMELVRPFLCQPATDAACG